MKNIPWYLRDGLDVWCCRILRYWNTVRPYCVGYFALRIKVLRYSSWLLSSSYKSRVLSSLPAVSQICCWRGSTSVLNILHEVDAEMNESGTFLCQAGHTQCSSLSLHEQQSSRLYILSSSFLLPWNSRDLPLTITVKLQNVVFNGMPLPSARKRRICFSATSRKPHAVRYLLIGLCVNVPR